MSEPLFTASQLTNHDLPTNTSAVPFTFVAPAELEPGQRWSTWDDIGVIAGPEPWPNWVITADAAVDTELGILKTGKEADVFLLERATPDESCVLAAKRYRSHDHTLFSRDSEYTDGRKMRNSRDRRAALKRTRWGRTVEAGRWAVAEFGHLSRLWSEGLPVPYPVQLDGTEILMELVCLADGSAAPRLAQARPDRRLLDTYWEQLTQVMTGMARLGLTHGDLSPFNILATENRIVLIDLPQGVDVVANPQGMEFLARDCRNVCTWFCARGLDVNAEELLSEVAAQLW
ncbi:MAG TPA: RIO1 family regulatory kinase/ATPase [Propionibacteriaceae bacterium]|nr:RIO1 family regulatory kinase/ATPase [Propionibacteriaceae bacterium]